MQDIINSGLTAKLTYSGRANTHSNPTESNAVRIEALDYEKSWAVVGAASAGIDLSFKYAERERAYAHTMFEQSTNQAYNLARAGNSALTGRLR